MPSVTPRVKKSVVPAAAPVEEPAVVEEEVAAQQEDIVMEDTPVVADEDVVAENVAETTEPMNEDTPMTEEPTVEESAAAAATTTTEGDAAAEAKKRKKHPKRNPENFIPYIRLLGAGMRTDSEGVKQNVSMDKDAYFVINSLVVDLAERLIDESSLMARHVFRQTLSEKDFIAATKKCLPGQLGAFARREVAKALGKYKDSKANPKASADDADVDVTTEEKKKGGKVAGSKSQSKSSRADIVMPVCRIKNLILTRSSNSRVSEFAPVALAAIMNYIVYEIIELAQKEASDRKRIRITCRDLKLSLENDVECREMILNNGVHVAIRESGETVFIHKALLPKKRGGAKKTINAE